MIVTENLKDFPPGALDPWNITAKSADEFLSELVDLDRAKVYAAVQRMADAFKNPPLTVPEVLRSLETSNGLLATVTALEAD